MVIYNVYVTSYYSIVYSIADIYIYANGKATRAAKDTRTRVAGVQSQCAISGYTPLLPLKRDS